MLRLKGRGTAFWHQQNIQDQINASGFTHLADFAFKRCHDAKRRENSVTLGTISG
jgi:hypothetical protein